MSERGSVPICESPSTLTVSGRTASTQADRTTYTVSTPGVASKRLASASAAAEGTGSGVHTVRLVRSVNMQ